MESYSHKVYSPRQEKIQKSGPDHGESILDTLMGHKKIRDLLLEHNQKAGNSLLPKRKMKGVSSIPKSFSNSMSDSDQLVGISLLKSNRKIQVPCPLELLGLGFPYT